MSDTPDWPLGGGRQLRPGQWAQVWIARRRVGRALYTSDTVLLEAPNWAPDDQALLLNGDGLLWRLDLQPRAALKHAALDGLPPINNDHVVDAGRRRIYLSANDGHIWVAPLTGGTASAPTAAHSRVRRAAARRLLRCRPARAHLLGGGETRYLEAGSRHLDGPEYSPDGAWLYVDTEQFAKRSGHAQLARVPADGGHLEQLVESDTVDWFPHVSPDAQFAAYVSFPTGLSAIQATSTSRKGWSVRRMGRRNRAVLRFRRPGDAERQQLVAGQSPVRVHGVPDRRSADVWMSCA